MVVKSIKKCPECGAGLTVKVTTEQGKQWTQYVCEDCGYTQLDKEITTPKMPQFDIKPKKVPQIIITPAKNKDVYPIIDI